MTYLLTTILVAVAFGYSLFKLYHFCLLRFLKAMNWKLEELKTYTISPKMKKWDRLIELLVIGIILWRFYTT